MNQDLSSVKIISWNINSIRLRINLLHKFIKDVKPDIICLQETKVTNNDFPISDIKKMGYKYIEFDGEKSYNGVCIISKIPLINILKTDILNYGHKRYIKADFIINNKIYHLHNFYVPAGGDVADIIENPKFDHKIKFLDWMIDYFLSQNGSHIMLGDMNIAPLEHDVWSHKQLINVVSHTAIEIEKMNKLQKTQNWVDTHRKFIDRSQKLYSWYSYRSKDPLKSNRGRRLDHIWCTLNLEQKIISSKIYTNYRIEKRPSDHVPIESIFNL